MMYYFFSPSHPTINLISAIKSLLNMAALRSRTVGFVACQFGSAVTSVVSMNECVLLLDVDCKQKDVELNAPGEAKGELGMLEGCVISILSRCVSDELLCGGDISTPLLIVSTKH